MNGNTGQYPGYYHQIAAGAKPYPSPTVLPNGHWPEQNGHPGKHPYPGPQPNAPTNLPPNFAVSPGSGPGGQHPNQMMHHQQTHYIRVPAPQQPPPSQQQLQQQQQQQQQPPPPSNGPYPPPQRAYAPNSAPGEPLRYPPPQNGNYYDPNLRKPVPNQANSPYHMYPPPLAQHQQQQQQQQAQQQQQQQMGQRHFLETRKAYMVPGSDTPRPRFMSPNFAVPPGQHPDPNRRAQSPASFNNANSTPKKPNETLNDLLRKPINDNSRHLRQVLTSEMTPPMVRHPSQPMFGAPPPGAPQIPPPQAIHVNILPPPRPTAPAPAAAGTPKSTKAMKAAAAFAVSNSAPKKSIASSALQPRSPAITAAKNPSQPIRVDAIEQTKPILVQPKMINIGPEVSIKKVILSLKSGLLTESKWAIDCLLVLSNTPKSIRLQPSLMLALLEHYKCNLNEIFDGLFDDQTSLEELTSIALQRTNDEDLNGHDGDDNDDKNDNHVDTKKRPLDEDVHDENVEDKKIEIKTEEKQESLVEENGHTAENGSSTPPVTNGSCDLESNQIDCNTGLSIVYKHDANIPRLKCYDQRPADADCIEDSICDRRKLRDVDTLDTSYISLNFDLEPDRPKPSARKQAKLSENYISIDNELARQSDNFHHKEAEMPNAEKISVLCTRKDRHDRLIVRCVSLSNVLYNVAFCKDNHSSLLNYPSLFTILSKILLYKHQHRRLLTFGQIDEANDQRRMCEDKENIEELFADFPYETLNVLRQNSFGIISNLAEDMNLCEFSDKIVFSLLDALLHWAVCRSAIARDPQKPDNLSFQLSALEILVKLTMKESNNDLILATPPYQRIETFYNILVDSLGRDEDPVVRELSLVILSNLAQTDYIGTRIVLRHKYSVSNIIHFIEQYEMARHHQYDHQPHTMNSHYMVRRASQFLLALANASIKDEIACIKRHEERIRNLALSTLLDDDISKVVADIMFRISK